MSDMRRFDTPESSEVAGWARKMGEVPDLLITAHFSLRALAKGEGPATSAEARQIIGGACALLDAALANVLEVTRNLPDVAPLNGRRAWTNRIGTDGQPCQDDRAASL
jgi:hypothetical protein